MTATVKGLLDFFESYYGEKYSGAFLEATAAYLDGSSADFCKAAAEVMIRRFSRSYGKSPCPADIERHMDEIVGAMPGPAAIPEPEVPATAEEKARGASVLEEIMRRLRANRTAPMAGTLERALTGREAQ